MKLRQALVSDRSAIQTLVASVLSEYGLVYDSKDVDRDLDTVPDFYTKRGGFFWVYEEDGLVLGSVGLLPLPPSSKAEAETSTGTEASKKAGGVEDAEDAGGLADTGRRVCEIRKMYLSPRCRGRGWGKKLLQTVLWEARRRGFAIATLESATVLKEALALYEKHGFQRISPCHLSSRCDLAYRLDLTTASLPATPPLLLEENETL